MRLIDADRYIEKQDECGWLEPITVTRFNEITPTIEAIPKDQYEARLKADMVAMLTEIQLEIEKMVNPFSTRISGCSQDGWKHGVKNCDFVIQQKINALRGNEND